MTMINFVSGLCIDINLDSEYRIGSGTTRTVYVLPTLPGVVLRVADYNCEFANEEEYELYKKLSSENFNHLTYLAACIDISCCGRYLLQERIECTLEDLGEDVDDWYDVAIPAVEFVDDIWLGNVGKRYDGTYCIIDYAAGLDGWLYELEAMHA
jgi:hypothetical protein